MPRQNRNEAAGGHGKRNGQDAEPDLRAQHAPEQFRAALFVGAAPGQFAGSREIESILDQQRPECRETLNERHQAQAVRSQHAPQIGHRDHGQDLADDLNAPQRDHVLNHAVAEQGDGSAER